MAQYRKKLVTVEASQWFKHGDHKAVEASFVTSADNGIIPPTVRAVMFVVCPGDWIITENGQHTVCKPDIFEATYEAVEGHAVEWTSCQVCGAKENCPYAFEVESIDGCAIENKIDIYNKKQVAK